MEKESLTLGYSPCPNDTFIFTAWVEGRIHGAPPVRERLADIDVLNRLPEERGLDVVKVSFFALGFLLDEYALLRSGGALGRGCGPLVVAREPLDREALASCRIAIPGERTTAALLLRLYQPDANRPVVMPFHEIMPAVRDGVVDAGLIIHESRFTYRRHGLTRVVDLGEWWETETGQAIPLGGIVIRRSLHPEVKRAVNEAIAASLRHAIGHPDDVWPTVRRHAREMEDDVMRRHIELYVNRFTESYGAEGETAIRRLMDIAASLGVVPARRMPLFFDEE